jgi:hypothetical protein
MEIEKVVEVFDDEEPVFDLCDKTFSKGRIRPMD